MGIYGRLIRGLSAPSGAWRLLDRAYVAPTYAFHHIPDAVGPRPSPTDIRPSRDRYTTDIRPSLCRPAPLSPPVHDRYTAQLLDAASARSRSRIERPLQHDPMSFTGRLVTERFALHRQPSTRVVGERGLTPGGQNLVECSEVFVGRDVSKDSLALAVAQNGRDGEVRFHGEIGSDAATIRRFVGKIDRPGVRRRFAAAVRRSRHVVIRRLPHAPRMAGSGVRRRSTARALALRIGLGISSAAPEPHGLEEYARGTILVFDQGIVFRTRACNPACRRRGGPQPCCLFAEPGIRLRGRRE